jgi:3-isopropylmalate/(R)-2-methylmalate dehydratase small subunit
VSDANTRTKPEVIEGRAWVLRDAEGRAIDDVDTDMIFHNAHLAITEVSEMGPHALGNLDGWEDFPQRTEPGDIVVAGRNWGAGSSRQQAVDCFLALGVRLIVCESVGAIYKRNAINSGFPILESPGVTGDGPDGRPVVDTGDRIRCDLRTGEVVNLDREGRSVAGRPCSSVQLDIYHAGDLFAYGRQLD